VAEIGPYQQEIRAVTCDDCPLRLLGEEAVHNFFATSDEDPFTVGDAIKDGIAIARGRVPLERDEDSAAMAGLERVSATLHYQWYLFDGAEVSPGPSPLDLDAKLEGRRLLLVDPASYTENGECYFPIEEAVLQMRALAQCFLRAKRACKAPK